MIQVTRTGENDPLQFEVTVSDEGSETTHHVTMDRATYQRLSGGNITPEACVEAAFKFLLDREPKESILSRFDVSVISRYFPDFPQQFSNYTD